MGRMTKRNFECSTTNCGTGRPAWRAGFSSTPPIVGEFVVFLARGDMHHANFGNGKRPGGAQRLLRDAAPTIDQQDRDRGRNVAASTGLSREIWRATPS